MAKRKRYTDEFRADAVLMLEAAGYTGDQDTNAPGALTAVSNRLDVPLTTLRRWYVQSNNPPPAELVIDKRLTLAQHLEQELDHIFNEMGHARPEASYRDLGIVAGVLFDKLQLLSGGPTSNENRRIIIQYADDYTDAS